MHLNHSRGARGTYPNDVNRVIAGAGRSKGDTMNSLHSRSTRGAVNLALLGVLLLGVPLGATLALERAASGKSPIRFFDAASQSAEFIGYSRSITLTPAQKKLKDQVLGAIPAPCCKAYPQATCCCPCNLAKTVWGLSNYLIVQQHASAKTLDKAVHDWLAFVNPKGFTGDLCDTAGGCARKFSDNGCGGMDERNLLAAR
jgi:hypothetical protein